MIDELTKHPGWAVLVDWLHTRMAPAKRTILNGSVGSHDEYLTTTGFLKGIHAVLEAPVAVASLVENEVGRRQEREEAEE